MGRQAAGSRRDGGLPGGGAYAVLGAGGRHGVVAGRVGVGTDPTVARVEREQRSRGVLAGRANKTPNAQNLSFASLPEVRFRRDAGGDRRDRLEVVGPAGVHAGSADQDGRSDADLSVNEAWYYKDVPEGMYAVTALLNESSGEQRTAACSVPAAGEERLHGGEQGQRSDVHLHVGEQGPEAAFVRLRHGPADRLIVKKKVDGTVLWKSSEGKTATPTPSEKALAPGREAGVHGEVGVRQCAAGRLHGDGRVAVDSAALHGSAGPGVPGRGGRIRRWRRRLRGQRRGWRERWLDQRGGRRRQGKRR